MLVNIAISRNKNEMCKVTIVWQFDAHAHRLQNCDWKNALETLTPEKILPTSLVIWPFLLEIWPLFFKNMLFLIKIRPFLSKIWPFFVEIWLFFAWNLAIIAYNVTIFNLAWNSHHQERGKIIHWGVMMLIRLCARARAGQQPGQGEQKYKVC